MKNGTANEVGRGPLDLAIEPPIIVDEHGTAMIFESVQHAEQYLEPIDVSNGEYSAYDSRGRLLKLIPTRPQITIKTDEPEPRHQNYVRNLLVQLLAYTGVAPEMLEDKSLEELVENCLRYKTK